MTLALTARILTEAGPSIGLGHLARCVALYDALETLGCACELVVAGEAPAHIVGGRAVREADWRTPAEAAVMLAESDIAVVDSYLAAAEVYQVVAETVAAAAYIDDMARLAYPRGFVVNANPEASLLRWPEMAEAIRLFGIEYQLLRAEFVGPPERATRERIERVLVVSGGTDAAGARQALAAAVRAAVRDAEIDVVDAPRSAAALRDAMLACDVAVSAAGQTLYELAATGTPTVAVVVADNQLAQARAFERAGAALLAGEWGESGTIEAVTGAAMALADRERREAHSAAARALVDGRGAERVARRLVGESAAARIELRPAGAADEAALLALANDPALRAASFQTDPIDEATHHAWFTARLANPDTVLLLAWDGDALVAHVRFDVIDADAIVSIGLSETYRGMDLSVLLLERAASALADARPEVRGLVARVRVENTASRRLFERAGFVPMPDTGESADGALEYRRAL